MSEGARNRKPLWFGVSVVLTVVILLVLAFLPDSGGKDDSIGARLAKLQTEAETRKLPRTVFHGKATPGNAWDDYQLALNDVLTWKEDPNGAALAQFSIGAAKGADEDLARKMLRDHAAIIAILRHGAQREEGQYPYHWERGFRIETSSSQSLLNSRRLGTFAAAQAKTDADGGRPQEAVELILDLTVFARDVGGNGTLLASLIGDAVYGTAFRSLRDAMLSGKLTTKDFESLAARLEIVEHDIPGQSPAFTNELLVSGAGILESLSQPKSYTEWRDLIARGGWRYGFSSRRLTEDYFDTYEAAMKRAQKLDAMDFASAKKESDAIEDDMHTSGKDLVSQMASDYSLSMVAHRETLAQLRLLRAAAIWSATGKMPAFADPFGTDLRFKEDAGKIRIWSVGSDGADDGGSGAGEPNRSLPHTDIVIEIQKTAAAK